MTKRSILAVVCGAVLMVGWALLDQGDRAGRKGRTTGLEATGGDEGTPRSPRGERAESPPIEALPFTERTASSGLRALVVDTEGEPIGGIPIGLLTSRDAEGPAVVRFSDDEGLVAFPEEELSGGTERGAGEVGLRFEVLGSPRTAAWWGSPDSNPTLVWMTISSRLKSQ